MISENIGCSHHDLKILGHRCSILGHFRLFCEILSFLGPLGGLLWPKRKILFLTCTTVVIGKDMSHDRLRRIPKPSGNFIGNFTVHVGGSREMVPNIVILLLVWHQL